MVRPLLLALAALAQGTTDGPVPKTESPGAQIATAETAAPPAATAAALAEYNARREKAPQTSSAQLALAQWCREQGLEPEAIAHATTAVELQPTNAAAWRLLGFTRVGNRWITDDQVREEARQREADRLWAPKMAAWHRALHAERKRGQSQAQREREAAQAERELAALDDPSAAPAVYREFAIGTAADQEIAIQLLGQIKAVGSSRALAALSVYGATPEIQRRAVETLRSRDPIDYVDNLVALLATPMQYQIMPARPGSAPGTLGRLVIDGVSTRLERSYIGIDPNLPGMKPDFSLRRGDYITFDQDGFPMIRRLDGRIHSPRQVAQQYQNAALAVQARIKQDIAAIEAQNAARRDFNAIVFRALRDATRQNIPDDAKAWTDWLAGLTGKPREAASKEKITFFQRIQPYGAVMPGSEQLAYLHRPYETPPYT